MAILFGALLVVAIIIIGGLGLFFFFMLGDAVFNKGCMLKQIMREVDEETHVRCGGGKCFHRVPCKN